METASALNNLNNGAMPQKTLDFRQAMHDFKVMFPMLDVGAIESVLRSNSGHVDATIDQLLQLSQSRNTRSNRNHNLYRPRNRNERTQRNRRQLSPEQYESTDSDDSIPIEILDPPTSSDDDFRDPPPMYTPPVGDTFSFDASPIEAPRHEKMPLPYTEYSHSATTNGKKSQYKAWNPPLLGKLPDDFLRILPQQFADAIPTSSNGKKIISTKPKKPSHRHSTGSQPSTSHTPDDRLQPPIPYPRPPKPVKDHILTNAKANVVEESPPIPPREPNFEPGHLFIRNSSAPSLPSNHRDFKLSKSNSRSNTRSKTSHSYHCHLSQLDHANGVHQRTGSVRCQNAPKPKSRQPQRRHSDFSSRRMIMVQPTAISSTPSPSSSRPASSNSSTPQRSRQRTPVEEEQYIEDRKLALLLQNEEFLKELQRNEDFLKSLENDNAKAQKGNDRLPETDIDSFNKPINHGDGFIVSPDPNMKYPIGPKRHTNVRKEGIKSPSENDREFKENMKHMGKSTKKKLNEIARKFSVKRHKSYKSMMNTVDPVFADCEEYNEQHDDKR